MPVQQIVHFRADGLRLVGTLHLPDRTRPPVVIGCHGLLADRRSPKQVALAEACGHEGYAYLRFDHRGCGDSQGEFKAVTSLEARCRDLRSAIDAMNRHPGVGPVLALFGSSFGGTVVLALAAESAHPPALVTFAAPIDSAAIMPSAVKDAAGRPVPGNALPPGLAFNITAGLERVHHLFVVHGRKDEIVPVQQARTIYNLTGAPKKILIQENGDHRMTDPRHQVEFEREFIEWIKLRRNSLVDACP